MALSAAIEIDARISGDGDALAVVNSLNIAQIVDLADDLHYALENTSFSFDLPSGSPCKSAGLGGVAIGKEIWVLDAGRPGLHPLQLVRRDAHGRNLQLLRDEITRRVAGKPWAGIGLPAPIFIVDNDARHLLQFPAFAPAGGTVLQRWADETGAIRFGAATPHQIEAFAASIAEDMKLLWRRRRAIAAEVKELRSRTEALLAEGGDLGCAVSAIAVQLSQQREFATYDYYVQFDGLDHANRPGVVLDFVPSKYVSEGCELSLPYGVCGRREAFQHLLQKGADGKIDEVTASLLRVVPEGSTTILDRLSRDYETAVSFETERGPLYATVYWRSGSLEAEICVQGHFDWAGEVLEVYSQDALSDEQLKAMIGGRVQDAFDLPIEIGCTIRAARQAGNGTVCLYVDVERRLLNTYQGRIF